jgi:hypothetical protein
MAEAMRRALVLTLVSTMAFVSMGTRFDHDARCDAVALEIVKTWWENSPILPVDIERRERFEKLGCPEADLEESERALVEESATS